MVQSDFGAISLYLGVYFLSGFIIFISDLTAVSREFDSSSLGRLVIDSECSCCHQIFFGIAVAAEHYLNLEFE